MSVLIAIIQYYYWTHLLGYQLTKINPQIVQPAIRLMLGRDKPYTLGNYLCQLVHYLGLYSEFSLYIVLYTLPYTVLYISLHSLLCALLYNLHFTLYSNIPYSRRHFMHWFIKKPMLFTTDRLYINFSMQTLAWN